MKKRLVLIATLALVCLMFIACPIQHSFDAPPTASPWTSPGSDAPITNAIDGAAPGFGGNVGVRIFLSNGLITRVDFDISAETDSFTHSIPGVLEPHIIRFNSFNFCDFIVSGATRTTRGLKEAARDAFRRENIPEAQLDFRICNHCR